MSRTGLADPRIRLSVNLIGGPSVSAEEYAEYIRSQSERTTVGVALAVRLPLGDYDDDRPIDLGQNRFTIRPHLGVLHTRGPWSFELTGSTFFYTENDDFFGDNSLEQDPLFGIQAHVVRTLGGGFWLSGGVAYARGGETEVNGSRATTRGAISSTASRSAFRSMAISRFVWATSGVTRSPHRSGLPQSVPVLGPAILKALA